MIEDELDIMEIESPLQALEEVEVEEDLLADAPDSHAPLKYGDFNTTIGDEYTPCCPDIIAKGVPFTEPSDVGKKVIEEACQELRKEGYAVDWYAAGSKVVALRTTHHDPHALRVVWRQKVNEILARDAKAFRNRR